MAKKFEYTTLAHRYTARYPLLTYLGTQTNFWILANILLVTIMHLQSRVLTATFHNPLALEYGTLLLIAISLGIVYGLILGLTGYYLDRNVMRKLPLGKLLLFKTLISFLVQVIILALLRYVIVDMWLAPTLHANGIILNDKSWQALLLLLVVYYFVMAAVINFINQVNKKYGPGIIVPLLMGRYRDPREEDRIFMFMDLKSSTTTAEELGHLKYSAFIRDCFDDINEVLYPFYAQVYQYAGDEIVVMWPESEGLRDQSCLMFFFACKKQFQERRQYYLDNYDHLPEFKAGAHAGTVTAVEIGEVKRDIAYHGDTLNTAARLQSICNTYGKSFLISKYLYDKVGGHSSIRAEDLGLLSLKGKATRVDVISVEWAE
ncbi:adenylate/guanylate cyclase domain-containing protein [Chryseolinea sp. T2]|uniref:adenylate/guanylate cyclase domain-containing protein n=1 Tax=Chryseolinea sp. T2 TaxID=3129255 RepID=UPI003077EBBF